VLKRLILASVLLGLASPALAAATTDPTHAIGLLPDQIQWKKGEASDTAWPIGDQNKPGACLELIRWHPGHFSHPHYHEHERYAVVLDGTWWVSTDNVYDPDHNTVPYPKGSVLTDLKGGVHYDGAKPETGDATIAIFMDCPLTGIPAEVKKQ
jgi:quercetin dioxygenase-like cupin family protein